MLKLTIWFM